MKRALLALALCAALACPVALAAAPAPSLPSVHAEFAPPAQAVGVLEADGLRWALLVFQGGDATGFDLALDGPVEATNETLYRMERADSFPVPVPSQRQAFGPVAGQISLAAGPWSSLYVLADSITLEATGPARLGRADGDRAVFQHMPPSPYPPDTTGPSEPPGGRPSGAVAAIADPGGGATPFRLAAEGVRAVRWHNATLACATLECPDSGRPGAAPTGPGGAAGLRRLSFITLEGSGGRLEGGGLAFAMAAGGPRIGLRLQGDLRLPDATLLGECGGAPCPDPAGRTFRAAGELSLSGLAPSGRPGYLQGDLGGAFGEAAFDETPVAAYTVAAGGAAVAGAVGLALLAKALFGLFARSARPPALRHPRRRQLYEVVQARPGLSYRELHRALGWPNGPLQNHLKRLVEEGLVVAQSYRNTVRYFENHGRYEATWRKVSQLHDPRTRQLHEWLASRPATPQGPIVAQSQAWGWSRTATQRLLRNLVDAGLASSRKEGRIVLYEAAPALSTEAGAR